MKNKLNNKIFLTVIAIAILLGVLFIVQNYKPGEVTTNSFSFLPLHYQTSFEGTYSPFTPNNGTSDIYPDSSAVDGEYSLRFIFPQGMGDGGAPDTVWLTFPATNELWLQFYIKVSENWQWHPIVQKLIYFRCGTLNDTNHFIGFNYDGPIGDGKWEPRAIGFTLQYDSLNEPVLAWGGSPQLLTKNTWHKVIVHMIINSPGKEDGIGQIWFDDELIVDAKNILWLNKRDSGGFYVFQFEPIFGGYDKQIVQEEMYIYFDNFIIQNTPF